MTRKVAPIEDRFWRHVQKTDTCWLWTGAKTHGGYGVISRGRGKPLVRAHRLSYEMHYGPIPEGLDCCHTCDTPSCVNPHHLYPGTAQINTLEMVEKGRNAKTIENHVRGTSHPKAKLTESTAAAIRIEYKSGSTSLNRLAVKYGVSKRTILNVIQRKIWINV